METDLFAVRWVARDLGGPAVRVLDQTLLPRRVEVVDCRDVDTVVEAISALRVRGAPAIGVAAAYGVVLGAIVDNDPAGAARRLTAARPTAVNLRWACERVLAAGDDVSTMLGEARRIEDENAAACEAIGRHGSRLIEARLDRPARV